MKCLATLMLVGLFAAPIVGCRAEGEIDDDDDYRMKDHRDHSMKTTEERTMSRDMDGDKKVTTETKYERN